MLLHTKKRQKQKTGIPKIIICKPRSQTGGWKGRNPCTCGFNEAGTPPAEASACCSPRRAAAQPGRLSEPCSSSAPALVLLLQEVWTQQHLEKGASCVCVCVPMLPQGPPRALSLLPPFPRRRLASSPPRCHLPAVCFQVTSARLSSAPPALPIHPASASRRRRRRRKGRRVALGSRGWIAAAPCSDPDSRLQNCHSRSVFTSAKPQPRLRSRRAVFSSLLLPVLGPL